MLQAGTILEDLLKRDIGILRTLARFHCATASQLHALCFPFQTLATARTTLYYLAEARFIARSTWRVRGPRHEQGQVWTFAAKGHDLLQRYVPLVPPFARIDLGRPSTALEHEEWRVRILVRTLLVRLILEARRMPLLCDLDVQLPGTASWPSTWSQLPQPEPDAVLSIVWLPAKRQPADWLPWVGADPLPASAVRYPIFVERTHARADCAELTSIGAEPSASIHHIPIMILQDEERCAAARQQLAALTQVPTVRMATPKLLQDGPVQSVWRDGHGEPCHLRALAEDLVL